MPALLLPTLSQGFPPWFDQNLLFLKQLVLDFGFCPIQQNHSPPSQSWCYGCVPVSLADDDDDDEEEENNVAIDTIHEHLAVEEIRSIIWMNLYQL